jgi:hypothetical protein
MPVERGQPCCHPSRSFIFEEIGQGNRCQRNGKWRFKGYPPYDGLSPHEHGSARMIFHWPPGYGSFNAVSKSATRPAAMSAMPCLNSSGIQESSDSTTNLVTSARWSDGKALIRSIMSCALRLLIPIRVQDETNSLVFRAAGFVARSLQIAADMRLARASPAARNPARLSLILNAHWNNFP